MNLYQTLNDSILLSSYSTFAIIAVVGILLSKHNANLRWLFVFLLAVRIVDTYLLIPLHGWLSKHPSFNDYLELVIYIFWAFTAWLCYRFILMRPFYSLKIASKLGPVTNHFLPGDYQPKTTKAEYLLAHIYAGFVFTKLPCALYILIKLGIAAEIAPGQHQWLVNINALITGKTYQPLMAMMSIRRAFDLFLTALEYGLLSYLIFSQLLYPSTLNKPFKNGDNNVRA